MYDYQFPSNTNSYSSALGILKTIISAVRFVQNQVTHSSFSLIQLHFVKLVQLAQFDKSSQAWQCKEFLIV